MKTRVLIGCIIALFFRCEILSLLALCIMSFMGVYALLKTIVVHNLF